MIRFLSYTLVFLNLTLAAGRAAEIESIAGTGKKGFSGDRVKALEADLAEPFGLTRGPDGLLYFCEFSGHVVRRFAKDGTLEIVAGIPGEAGPDGDGGPATKAKLNKPHEIRFDSNGDLYISDMSNHAIRKVEMKTGIISTFAGVGRKGFSGDGGPAAEAAFNDPIAIQFGPDGDLYICDIGNHRLRAVDMKTGKVRTVCGNGQKAATSDGAPLSPETPLHGPRTLDFDAQGNGYLALREGNAVFRFDLKNKRLTHIAGTGKQGRAGDDGPAKEAQLAGPKGLALSPDSKKVFLADTESHTIRVIDLETGMIHGFIGDGKKGDGPDGDPLKCRLARPHGIFIDNDGTAYVGDSDAHRIRKLSLR